MTPANEKPQSGLFAQAVAVAEASPIPLVEAVHFQTRHAECERQRGELIAHGLWYSTMMD